MFDRLLSLVSEDDFKKIQNVHILLVGVGGVGGYTLESLVRSGFKNITIVDGDIISESNLNRQIIAKNTNIGKAKVDEAELRMKNINTDLLINKINVMLTKENFYKYINGKYDYIIDACDSVAIKVLLVKYASENNIKIISSLGMGKRLDAKNVEITTLDKTYNCSFAKKFRHLLRKEGLSINIPVVFSKEAAITTADNALGSIVFVPAVAGIYMANYVFSDIINK